MDLEMSEVKHLRFVLITACVLLGTVLVYAFSRVSRIETLPSYALVPAQKVVVNPGDNIQGLVDRSPEGTAFLIKAGVHRLQSIVPKDGDSFTGEPGAILNGAKLLTSFERQGRYWVAAAQTQQGSYQGQRQQGGYQGRWQQGPFQRRRPQGPFGGRRSQGPYGGRQQQGPRQGQQGPFRGRCRPDHPACVYPEDVFVDDAPLQRVTILDDVAPGKWYADSAAGKIYLGDDPTGHKVEISVTRRAFSGLARDVMIRGLIVEKYAQPAGQAAIDGVQPGEGPFNRKFGENWVVEENEVRLNHGAGIKAGTGWRVRNNKVHHNGQVGLGGAGRDILVEGNEIAYNNYAGYFPGWEAGGAKFAFTENLTVRNNYSHHNEGPGLWTDIRNSHTLYERNRVTANQGSGGIMHEISYDAVIRDNTVWDDGLNPFGPGAGILVAESSDVEVYKNTVTNCQNGIMGRQLKREDAERMYGGAYLLKNLRVHDNVITQNEGIAAGIIQRGRGLNDDVFTRWNNRFENNTFKLADPNGRYFLWMGTPRTLVEWREIQKQ